MTEIPEGLWPGPEVDDRPTFYGPRFAVPENWPYRLKEDDTFHAIGFAPHLSADYICQCRAPEMDFLTITIPRETAASFLEATFPNENEFHDAIRSIIWEAIRKDGEP